MNPFGHSPDKPRNERHVSASDVDAAFEKMELLKGAYLAKAKSVLAVNSNED